MSGISCSECGSDGPHCSGTVRPAETCNWFAPCLGPVCVDCCRCLTCGRRVGTRHLDVCACPPAAKHTYCRDCNAHRVARLLCGPPIGEDDWPQRRDALPDLAGEARA